MLAESARLFTSSPRESLIGSPPPPPTPVDSSLCGSRGVRLSSEAPAANAGAAAFPATVKCARQAPSVNRFHHPRPFTTLVGSPRTRNLFQISGLPPAASYLTESLADPPHPLTPANGCGTIVAHKIEGLDGKSTQRGQPIQINYAQFVYSDAVRRGLGP